MIPSQRASPCPSGTSLLWDALARFSAPALHLHLPSERDSAAFESAVHSVLIKEGRYRQRCRMVLWMWSVVDARL